MGRPRFDAILSTPSSAAQTKLPEEQMTLKISWASSDGDPDDDDDDPDEWRQGEAVPRSTLGDETSKASVGKFECVP